MFFSEKLQPWKSKWAEFKEMSFGYSIFSTCLGEEKGNSEVETERKDGARKRCLVWGHVPSHSRQTPSEPSAVISIAYILTECLTIFLGVGKV